MTAFKNANDRFQSTLKEQQKKDDMQVEIVFLVGFVAVGGLLAWGAPLAAAGFAGTSIGARATKLMTKIPGLKKLPSVNGVVTVSNTGFTRHLVEGLRSELKTFVKTHGKLEVQLAASHANMESIQVNTMHDVEWYLNQQICECFNVLSETVVNIDRSDACTEAEKSEIAAHLAKSPFLASVPNLKPMKEKLEESMEYTFFLNHIMEMDRLVISSTAHPNGFGAHSVTTTEKFPIDQGPSNPSYPKGFSKYDPKNHSTLSSHIDYEDPGNDVAERVNQLYRSINNRGGSAQFMVDDYWFKNGVGKQQIALAEKELEKQMNVSGMSTLFANLKAH